MDEFINNVTDIWWWLQHIPSAFVAIAIATIYKKTPLFLKKISRWLKLRELKRLKNKRFNYSSVMYEITKSHTLMLLFSMLCIAYFYTYTQVSRVDTSWLVVAIKTSPLYIVEILYLRQREHTKSLVRLVGKIRLTRH
ncbi:hypothetical protein [Aeromonas enteropelogenes]|uniref:hypothetical protein n=1 Tax=Aeromonas enteropelogenes TaxID=29489 RepID=UPI00398837FD